MQQLQTGNTDAERISVLFVCLGNICRSPVAEGVFRHRLRDKGLADYFKIDSAGTGAWHVGQKPDARMSATAISRGISLSGIRARQFTKNDFLAFDHIFAMDRSNLLDIVSLDQAGRFGNKVRLFREADPIPGDYQVPDPYYGHGDGFLEVYTMVDRTVLSLIDHFVEAYDML